MNYKTKTAYLFLFPTVVIVISLLISPVFSGIGMSFFKERLSGELKFMGIDNFIILFNDPRFINNITLTFVYIFGVVILSTPLAYISAIIITTKLKAIKFFRPIFLLPWIVAPVVSATLLFTMTDPSMGFLNEVFSFFAGEETYIRTDPVYSMVVVILHSFWRSFPFMMIFLAAGISSIPKEIYDAAIVDGANIFQRFFYMTFPLTKLHLSMVILMISMWTMQDAESIYALTGGGPGYSTEVLAVRLLKEAFINFNMYKGAVIGVVFILISIIFVILYVLNTKSIRNV